MIIELIVKYIGEALVKGLDPVEHVRKRLEAHPAIPNEMIADLDTFLKEAAELLPEP